MLATKPAIESLLVCSRDAARMLCISERTLWTITASGALPVVRIRGAKRYAVDDLRALIAAKTKNRTCRDSAFGGAK